MSGFIRTEEDDKFEEMIIKKYHLITKEMENDYIKKDGVSSEE